ncbi:hypothetical protein [Nostoc sp. 'Peltigera membranacea cyanobiont' 210A]|uniref:hypothetical protein n=1 Tax=Nostoc sp. 'Peltigera membranacea cyanobiont' 210A TaxID=2014529 RepID=UPI001CB9A642|nr:hypothetical protein [Nostoc sp. 'Peltigera membranacea cyanobiont' 210A]
MTILYLLPKGEASAKAEEKVQVVPWTGSSSNGRSFRRDWYTHRHVHLNPVESFLAGLLAKHVCVEFVFRQSKRVLISRKKNNHNLLDLLVFLLPDV